MSRLLLATLLLASPPAVLAQNAPVTATLIRTVQAQSLGAGPLALSPDGQTLAVRGGTGWSLFDASTLQPKAQAVMDTRRFPPPEVQFSPDGAMLLADVGGTAAFDARTGRALWQGGEGRALFSPDGERVSLVSPSGTLTVLDAHTGQVVRGKPDTVDPGSVQYYRSGAFFSRPLSIAVNPAGHLLASGSFGGGIALWNPATGERSGVLTDRSSGTYPTRAALAGKTAHGGRVTALAFAQDGTLISGANDGTIKRWDPATGRKLAGAFLPDGVQALTLRPSGRSVLVASGLNVVELSLPDLRRGRVLVGHADKVSSLAASGDTLWTSGADGTVKRWNLDSGLDEATYGTVKTAAVSPDGQTLALNLGDATVRVTDGQGNTVNTLRGFLPPTSPRYEFVGARSLAFGPDGRRLAGGILTMSGVIIEKFTAGSAVFVWNVGSGQLERKLPNFPIQDLAWSPDGTFLAGVNRVPGELAAFEVRNVVTGAGVSRGRTSDARPPEPVTLAVAEPTVQWVGGQAWVLGMQYPQVKPGQPLPSRWPTGIWRASTGALMQSLGQLAITQPRLAANPAGTRVVISGGNGLWLLDAQTGKALRSYPEETYQSQTASWQEQRRLLWSPDGRLFALNRGEAGLSLHDGGTGERLGSLPAAEPLGFSEDGRTLVTLNGQGVQTWRLGQGR